MSNITERLKDAVNQFPAIEEHPRKLFVDSLAEIERLQVRVAELYSALDNVNERLADGCQLSGDEIDDVDAALLNTGCEAFILRKQADAVEAFVDWVKPHWPTSIAIQIADDSRSYVFELRNERRTIQGR